MSDECGTDADSPPPPLEQMDWCDIHEPGCYLHIASGLLARLYSDDILHRNATELERGGGQVVRLAASPGAPLKQLRAIAQRHGLSVNA